MTRRKKTRTTKRRTTSARRKAAPRRATRKATRKTTRRISGTTKRKRPMARKNVTNKLMSVLGASLGTGAGIYLTGLGFQKIPGNTYLKAAGMGGAGMALQFFDFLPSVGAGAAGQSLVVGITSAMTDAGWNINGRGRVELSAEEKAMIERAAMTDVDGVRGLTEETVMGSPISTWEELM